MPKNITREKNHITPLLLRASIIALPIFYFFPGINLILLSLISLIAAQFWHTSQMRNDLIPTLDNIFAHIDFFILQATNLIVHLVRKSITLFSKFFLRDSQETIRSISDITLCGIISLATHFAAGFIMSKALLILFPALTYVTIFSLGTINLPMAFSLAYSAFFTTFDVTHIICKYIDGDYKFEIEDVNLANYTYFGNILDQSYFRSDLSLRFNPLESVVASMPEIDPKGIIFGLTNGRVR